MVYLLHFDERIGGPGSKGAQHYLGYAGPEGLWKRLRQHATGDHGAKITKAFRLRGIPYRLARTWPGATRDDERRLKRNGHVNRYCPICDPEHYWQGRL